MERLPRLSGEDADFNPIKGTACWIRACQGANDSLKTALGSISNPVQKKRVAAKIKSYLEMLADGEQLHNPDRFRKEGPLPGQSTGNFSAVRYIAKNINLRAYVFIYGGDWWISHFINKKKDNLAPGDTRRVQQNYRSVSGNN